MIGAVLVAAVATVAVGAFGINRMSALSEAADVVYTEGTVPVDALRKLQVDWWELQTHIARANIEALPAESRASSQEKAAPRRADPRRGRRGGRLTCRSRPTPRPRSASSPAPPRSTSSLVAQLQQIVTEAQEQAAAARRSAGRRPPAQRGGPAGRRRPAGSR